ncbi:MAG: class I SAM-dependent methyltransferase [Verrucomicrobia bacterium]|nr:class I SAM-dependent methyltransferase [Cytophagales bacterium]
MNLIEPLLSAYAEKHTSPENQLLATVNRQTYLEVLMPHMVSGHLQGRLLAMLSQMIRPERILEIGTFTGYAALCLAEGLTENGKLTTIDINEELEERVRDYFTQAGLENKIEYIIGNALAIIPTLTDTFDLVFIDADKQNYANYYDLIFEKVRKGGFIIADNVLWSGKVTDENPDKETRNILAFNKKIQADPRTENVLLPVRDGLMVVRKMI